jgi:hypothetical protein
MNLSIISHNLFGPIGNIVNHTSLKNLHLSLYHSKNKCSLGLSTSYVVTNKFFVSFNNLNHRTINNKPMSICRTSCYTYFPILGDHMTNLKITPIGNENKINSLKSALQSLEHPFIKQINSM